MSETETSVPMDSKALFDAAISEPVVETPTETVATPEPDAGPARDEQGRFAAKAEPEQAAEAVEPVKQEAPATADAIPPWRLREEAEGRRQAEGRAQQLERQLHDLSGRLKSLEKPAEPIDPYVDPEKFRDAGVRQAIDPITRQMSETREYYSRKDAIRTHGLETVQEAYKWLESASHAGDPKVAPLLQRITSSIDPFEDVVSAFKRDKALSTVGDDPNAWFEKELERRKADPAFVSKYLSPTNGQNGAQSPANVVKLPPSLNRQPGSATASAGSMRDEDLYQSAIR